ncbi:LysR family transcriptional regulator [Aeromicrobium ginsengisoli]|uniref:LysR family transcriptional regulator n=1 Tax=Aeromicrobium ginsengisoli TaxID=363867 RepID=A0A5M4FKS0_9ACTN|nr:LysR family transcriptional regulator [Aeromicrobium ginsengisoli]KAA1400165.1 LysR family transcriptional regulator [Aeromicrobium ginsengisoli]
MEIRQIECFLAVSESLSFRVAGESLGIGQPAVSGQVARLERELGQRLFERTSRVVRLTPAGQRLVPEARSILASVDRARAAVAVPGEPVSLRLGSSTGLGQRLDLLLETMNRTDPDVSVELGTYATTTRLDRVRSGQLDAAFVRGVETAAGLDVIPVWDDPLLVAMPTTHPAAGEASVDLAALASLPLWLVPRKANAPLVDLVMSACAAAGFEPTFGSRASKLPETLASIGNGGGWTVVYAPHAQQLRHERVAFRPVDPQVTMPTCVALQQGSRSRLLTRLIAACAEVRERADDQQS